MKKMSEKNTKLIRKRKRIPVTVEENSRATRSSVRIHNEVNTTHAVKPRSDEKVRKTKHQVQPQQKDLETKSANNKRCKIKSETNGEVGSVKDESARSVEEKKVSAPKVLKKTSQTKSSLSVLVNGSVGTTGEKYAGAHVSAAGGLENAVTDAVSIGARSFALFLRSQRQWNSKPLGDSTVEKFKAACKEHGFPPHLILPHGSYLLNLGSPNQETLLKSRDLLIDELKRCERLGLTLYNFHPGSSCGKMETSECISLIAKGINMALKETKFVKVVLENMSKQGFTVGGDLQEIRDIIDLVEDKSRVGVCIDTCHTFAAGYDISTEKGFQEFLDEFDRIIGMEYLVAVHVNDSKGEVGCHKDRHENIGKGKLGKEPFQFLMNSPHFNDIPLILETPYVDGVYKREVKLLNSFIEK